MKNFKRTIGIAAGILALSAQAQAAITLIAGPTSAITLTNSTDDYCQVMNTGTSPATITIEARDDAGIAKAWKQVTLIPEQTASLYGGKDVANCAFKTTSKRIVAMLLGRDPVTGFYTVAIPARR